ncbi:MAG TPA: hypothetical protein PK781_02440 [Terrimesophilobacter sp.]|nr:hypothetical protein [Terrimesophilobacter sp.]HRP99304.1 hypothetical protein [Terrimesophilobacter sp.]
MHDDAAVELAERLALQERALRHEWERVHSLKVRLAHELTDQSWRGITRNAVDAETAVLRRGLGGALAALEEALACTARAKESVHGRVG